MAALVIWAEISCCLGSPGRLQIRALQQIFSERFYPEGVNVWYFYAGAAACCDLRKLLQLAALIASCRFRKFQIFCTQAMLSAEDDDTSDMADDAERTVRSDALKHTVCHDFLSIVFFIQIFAVVAGRRRRWC